MKKENHQLLAEEVIEKASLKGADFSDVVIFENTSRNISCRLGKIEEIEYTKAINNKIAKSLALSNEKLPEI